MARAPEPLTESGLPAYLRDVGVASQPEDELVVDRAGEGNINWVRRVRARDGSAGWVVKQARPALERFPEYRVSTERIVFEARYYETVAPWDADRVCPRVVHFDPERRTLVLEDLSGCERLDACLAAGGPDAAAASAAARRLGAFLGAVHAGSAAPDVAERFRNDEMRRLHGDHVFHLPYRPNDFPLSPAVAGRARAIWRDAPLVTRVDAAYARYLEAAEGLVHADVQPTNVLLAPRGAVLLDAEIAHAGDPAFDVGVLAGHLWLAALARGEAGRPRSLAELWSAYLSARGERARGEEAPDWREVARYAGIEMLRRTLGAARVPAAADDDAALAFVEVGTALVSDPPASP